MNKTNSVSRRGFLQRGSGTVAAAVTLQGTVQAATPVAAPAGGMPRQLLGAVRDIPSGGGKSFHYPDAASPCLLLRMNRPVAEGVGPNRDLVAYSVLCAHMGCPLRYEPQDQVFKCNCHFSIFDAEQQGQMVCGQASRSLARIELAYDADHGTVSAVGVDGLIYGRVSNAL